MRMASPVAAVLATSALVAGCAQVRTSQPGPTGLTPVTPSRTTSATAPAETSATATTAGAPAAAPAAGAPPAEAIAWVQAAPPADAADFRVALRDGAATPLADDIAFTTASGISCMTEARRDPGALACLVDLTDPPPPTGEVYGVWKGGWVDFDGAGVRIGSAHGDPGPFRRGRGVPLPVERSLSFGDFRCRADTTVLVCVNYARQTAVRYSDAGVEPFGCTRQDPPQPGIGIQYVC